MNAYERVKLSRERTRLTFPLPGVSDCIRYAICEMAEMDDAWLRIERAADKRNNVRVHDPAAELGQAIYMLLSAAVQVGIDPTESKPVPQQVSYECTYAYVMYRLSSLLSLVQASRVDFMTVADNYGKAYMACVRMAEFGDHDVEALVDDACAAFEAKHMAIAKEDA